MIAFLMALFCLFAVHSAEAQWTEPVLMDSNEDTLGVNTENWKEWCPFLSADGQYFYFARDQVNNDIFVSHRVGEVWSDPLKLPFCTESGDERNPAVNATNDTLYFITFSGGWNIFWCFRTGDSDTSWSQPEVMPAPINSGGIEFSVWCTPDNQRLLFSSARPGGNGGEDIYECQRDAQTETGWSNPQMLVGQLNTWTSESYPSMGLDTTEIFFQRIGYTGLYVARRSDSGWQEGVLLPDNINRVIQQFPSETTPCVTPDGHRLYFMSRWNGDSTATNGDIWYSERPTSAPDRRQRRTGALRSLHVYPNPTNGPAMLESVEPLRQVTLFNLLGQTLVDYTELHGSYPVHFDLSSQVAVLPVGVYWVRATGRTGTYVIPFRVTR